MPFLRRRRVRIAARCLAGCVAIAAIAACQQPAPETATTPAPAAAVPRTEPIADPTAGPRPPADGVALGAWVAPETFDRQGRTEALTAYEEQLAEPMKIVHVFHPWDEFFPTDFDRQVVASRATLLLSWAGTDTRRIASGQEDALIRERAAAVRDLGRPILLRWRWEMDRPNLADEIHSPEDYIAAWSRIRQIFAEVGADNAGWVWCPLAGGFDTDRAAPYYPGDDQVDWICADVYADDPAIPFADLSASFLSWAAGRDKPIVLAEWGVQRAGTDRRAAWLREAAATVREYPQIKALVYFDSDIDRDGRIRRWSLRNWPQDIDSMRAIAGDRYFRARLRR